MSHVTYVQMRHDFFICDMTHLYIFHMTHLYVQMSHVTYLHVTYVNQSCHTYEWVMSHMNKSCHTYEWDMSHVWISHVRVAPLRMGVRRAAPDSQVLPDFEVICCPWRAASADQGSLYGPLFGKEIKNFFCSNLVRTEILLFREISLFPSDFAVLRFEQKNLWISFPKRGPYRLPWSTEAALQGQLITWKSGRTCLPGAALLTPILKGATLSHIWMRHVTHMNESCHTYEWDMSHI